MRILKRFIGILCSTVLMASSTVCLQTSAYSTTKIIDNDVDTSDVDYKNMAYGNWTKITGSYLYGNNSARMATASQSNSYTWEFKKEVGASSGNNYCTLYVYLNSSQFNDTASDYYLETSSNSSPYGFGALNQNTAPAGWSIVGSKGSIQGNFKKFKVHGSGINSTKKVGADGIKAIITY